MFRRIPVLILGAALLAAVGCSVDTELGGVAVPNARPDTRITGQPPTLLEAGFTVEFHWTGSDPDGRVVGYQWKISDNGLDGISPRDTLTIDPLTGAVMNPWRFTTTTDSIFVVLADLPDFPGDEVSPRSFRTHSIFVRAMDDKGAVDPSPAYLSFTSTTIVPTARAVFPQLGTQSAKVAPPTVNIGWEGTDPDFELRVPTKVRYLWKRAQLPDGTDIRTPTEYNRYYEELIDFDDPDWSTWQRYSADPEDRLATFERQPSGTFWLFAVQTQDTAGAVSVGRRYGVEVGHLQVLANFYTPAVVLREPFLGASTSGQAPPISIAAGQPLNFSWSASAASYNGEIVSYRHGWNLISIDDVNDPGWAVPPGTGQQNRFARERSFQEGFHTFVLVVTDDSGQQKIMERRLEVVPYVDYNLQSELLVIDQVVDSRVQNWQDRSGIPRNDEQYRNEFWSFLQEQPGGVAGVDWGLDRLDHTADIRYANLVNYKAVLIYAQSSDQQIMMRNFRPENGVDKYVWLIPYQDRGGNLFLVGGGSMDSFLEVQRDTWMTPIIFDTREETYTSGTQTFTVGFGTKELADGTEVQRGPLQYPYLVAGISALDWTSVNTKYIYARPRAAMNQERRGDCVGLKAVYLDPAFRAHWLIGPGAVADTIGTEPTIDWQDAFYDLGDTLDVIHNTFPFRNDEFVNANISTRSTQFAPQECPDNLQAPGGMCIEPMFRGIARFDWLREKKRAEGDPNWPAGTYLPAELDELCGTQALAPYGDLNRATARTNGRVYGYLSYKLAADKPRPGPDVFWGFDPYRFDHVESKKAVRWVLKQVFGLDVIDN
ncbi:MAG: hypothetical protein ABR506_10905 [Candidatus Krumholzibacteriia bacterium]